MPISIGNELRSNDFGGVVLDEPLADYSVMEHIVHSDGVDYAINSHVY